MSQHFYEKLVRIGRPPWMLPGTLAMPASTEPVAGVVLVHGAGPHDRDETVGALKPFRDLAHGLASRGFGVLRYEKRTKYYAAALSDHERTVRDETIDDALHAVEFMRRDIRIDERRLFVIGHSLGGTLAPWIAREEGGLAGLVIMAGAARPLQTLFIDQMEYLATVAPLTVTPGLVQRVRAEALRAMNDLWLSQASERQCLLGSSVAFWRQLNAYDPLETAWSLATPILILHGGRDYHVTTTDLDAWRDALSRRHTVRFVTYPDLNHCFVHGVGPSRPREYCRAGQVAAAVVDDIASWMGAVA